MIVDTSALVAVVVQEPAADEVLEKLLAARSAIGTPTVVELGIVLSARLGLDARGLVSELLRELAVVEIAFETEHWREAVSAFWRFGRGRHRAGLNFGDCLSYAVARVADEPLLFVGDDFAETDVVAA